MLSFALLNIFPGLGETKRLLCIPLMVSFLNGTWRSDKLKRGLNEE